MVQIGGANSVMQNWWCKSEQGRPGQDLAQVPDPGFSSLPSPAYPLPGGWGVGALEEEMLGIDTRLFLWHLAGHFQEPEGSVGL